jgi:putative endonuclease
VRRDGRGASTSAHGKRGEDRACQYLRALGYRIVERNFRCKLGELDIIARDGSTLVFTEVRSRTDSRHGTPLETVTWPKQRRIAQVASYYLSVRQPRFDTCRFDVVGITGENIEHVKDAFRLGP